MIIAPLLKRKIQVAFGSALVLLLVVNAISIRGLIVSGEGTRWVRHTYDVLETLQETRFAMQTITASVRGYVLTANESYLVSYRASKAVIERGEATLLALTVDNPSQQARLAQFKAVAALRFQRAEAVTNLSRDKGMAAAAEAIRIGDGQGITDQFQTVFDQMQDAELRLLALRDASADQSAALTMIVLILGTALGLTGGIAAIWSVQRDSAKRRAAEQALLSSENKYGLLVQGVVDYAIVMLGLHGEIISWNTGT